MVGSPGTAMVAETVGKEYKFFHLNLTRAMKDEKIPVLRRLCADDPRNNDSQESKCKCCGREGDGTSKEILLEQLIDTAAFIGTVTSAGTLLNSHLSTSCSRLQKQAHSLAALSCDSYVDMVHTKIKDTAWDFLDEHQHSRCTEDAEREMVSEDEYAESTRVTCVASDCEVLEVDVANTNPGTEHIREEKEENVNRSCTMPKLVALYNGHKFENQLTRFHLTGAALHAQALKYHQEAKYMNYKDSISYTHHDINCKCGETLTELLSPNQEGEGNGMVQENFQTEVVQDAHRQGLD